MGRRTQIFLLAAVSALLILVIYKFFITEFGLANAPGWNTMILPKERIVITTVLVLTFFGGTYGIISLILSRKERE